MSSFAFLLICPFLLLLMASVFVLPFAQKSLPQMFLSLLSLFIQVFAKMSAFSEAFLILLLHLTPSHSCPALCSTFHRLPHCVSSCFIHCLYPNPTRIKDPCEQECSLFRSLLYPQDLEESVGHNRSLRNTY